MRMHGEWLGSARVRFVLLVVLTVAGAVPVMSRGARWLGSWKLALDEGSGSIVLLGPVAAGIACGVYVRLRRSHVDDLLSQAARPWRGWTAPALAVWALSGAAVLLLSLSTTTGAWLAGSKACPQLWWAIVPGLLVLGAEVSLGALIGSLAQHYWVVPWVAVGTFLLFLLTRLGIIPVVFDTGPTTGALIGETFYPPWFLFQAVAAAGIGCVALAASHPALFRSSHLAWRATTLLSAAMAAITLLALRAPLDRYEPAPPTADACIDGHPTVCMTQDGHRPLPDLASKMESLARPLLDADVPLPEKFVPIESISAADRGVGILSFFDEEELAREVDDAVAARSLATPARCPAFFADQPPPETYFSAYGFLVRWLLVQSGDEDAPTEGSLARWWALPVGQQYPWLRATYAALTDCRLDDLGLPVPPTAG